MNYIMILYMNIQIIKDFIAYFTKDNLLNYLNFFINIVKLFIKTAFFPSGNSVLVSVNTGEMTLCFNNFEFKSPYLMLFQWLLI
jgi:hypothetical protein